MNITDVKKIKNRGKQNFKDDANNKQLDKEDTQQSNLNSKYLSRTLVLNILILLCFYMCQIRLPTCTCCVKYNLMLWYKARVNEMLLERLVVHSIFKDICFFLGGGGGGRK